MKWCSWMTDRAMTVEDRQAVPGAHAAGSVQAGGKRRCRKEAKR